MSPWKPKRPCKHPGCPNLSDQTYCEVHRKKAKAEANHAYDENNRDMNLRKFYVSPAWRKLRALKLQRNPLCEICYAEKRIEKAEIVDHIRPVKDYPDGALDMDNLQSLCLSCHSRKTRQEEKARRATKTADREWKF